MSWATQGAEAAAEFEKEHTQKETQREQSYRMWRFWLKPGEEARITFIDGDLVDGKLNCFSYPQHTVYMNGNWNNHFVCVAKQEPCPVCESGNNASRVAVFTIIDHRVTTSKDGKKTYSDQPRLFVAKYNTFQLLQNMAAKRGGLAGITVDAFRADDHAANVGSAFDFIEKNDVQALRNMFFKVDEKTGKKETYFVPANYVEEAGRKTAAELRELGFGGAPPLGSAAGNQAMAAKAGGFEDQL